MMDKIVVKGGEGLMGSSLISGIMEQRGKKGVKYLERIVYVDIVE